jgi:hypothetical protein
MNVVLPSEGDLIVVEGDEAMVGDGNAVSVASQVVEDMFCPAEGRFRVDDPLLMEELIDETVEAIGLSEADDRAVKVELVLVKDMCEPVSELAAEDAAEYMDGLGRNVERRRSSRSGPSSSRPQERCSGCGDDVAGSVPRCGAR